MNGFEHSTSRLDRRNISIVLILLGFVATVLILLFRHNTRNIEFGELLFGGNSHTINTINADGSSLVVLVEKGNRLENPNASFDWYITWLQMKIDDYERRPPLFTEIRNRYATWSPDGSTIAYLSDKDGVDSIYLIREGNSRDQRLTQDLSVDHYVWLNNSNILFYRVYPDEQVYLLDINSKHISPMNCINKDRIVPSPDGTRIATVDFVSNIEYENDQWIVDFTFFLVIVKPDCSQRTAIVEREHGFCDIEWSPNGKHLLFVDRYFEPDPYDPEGTRGTLHCNQLYRVQNDGSDLIKLDIGNIPLIRYFAWSPDGQRIAFTSQQVTNKGVMNDMEQVDVNEGVYIMNYDGSDVLRISNDPARDVNPVWSSTGDKVAFTSVWDSNIYIYSTVDGKTSIVTDQHGFGLISWRP